MGLRIVLIVLLVVVLFVILVPAFFVRPPVAIPPASRFPATTQIGRIVTAGHGGIVLSDAAGIEHSFPVYNEANIRLDGAPIALEDLPHGRSVRVAVRRDGEVMAIASTTILQPDRDNGPHPIWP
jgi:hypothetical protein